MTVYAKSMMESLAEVRGLIVEDNMDLMKKAAAGSMQTIKMKDGKLKMDSFTASGIMQVYDKVSSKNKKTMEQIINSGKKNQIMKLQAIAMKAEYNPQEEEVELDEAKYDIYHKDFSSAMQHAYAAAKKMYGITVDPKEIDDKVASGPRKPSSGKTNKYRLKGDKGTVQIQVANLDNKKYELNMYKEEAELDEGDPFMGPTKGKGKVVTVRHKTSGKELVVTIDSVKKYEKMGYKVVKEEVELGEGFINIGGAKVKDDEKSILQHIKKTFPNVKKVRKDPQHGWIPVFEEDELDEWTISDVEIAMKKKYGKVDKEAIEKLKKVQYKGNVDRNDLVKAGHGKLHVESVEIDEGDPFMGPTKGKDKVVTVRHKTSGKELSVTANSVKKYEKMGYKVVKETTEIGERVAEQLSRIKGNSPGAQGRRAAVEDDIEDAEKNGDKKLVKKLKEDELDEVFNGTKQDIRKITRATDNALRKRSAQIQKMLKSKTNEKGKGLTDFEFDHISDEGDAIAAELVYRKKGGKDPISDAIPSHLKKFVNEEVELDEGKAKYTRKLMKNKSIVDYVKKQQEKNRKDVAKFGNKKVGVFGNEPRFDSGDRWLDMASDEVKQNRMSDNKRRAFDAEAEYEAIARKLGLDKFEPKLEEVELDEGRMKELHGYIAQGKSAEWIAKKMGVDAKTIKALMAGYKEAYEVGTDEYREYLEKLTPGEVDEASARADAMRAMRRDKKVDPADVDTSASDADVKAASKNILAQMRKAVSLGGRFDVEFLDKKKVRVKPAIANAFVKKYEGMRRPADKERFQNQAMKSYKDMLKVLKAGYNEEVELDEAKYEHIFGVEFQVDAPEEKPIRTGKEPHVKTIDKLTKKHKLITDHADDLSKFNVKDKVGGKNVMKFFKDMERSGLEVIKKRITDNAKSTSFGEEVDLDEALPPHLQKHFDKDGNPKTKEGKAAWERIKKIKMKGYTPKQVKMAIGIAFDKRFVQGNMTGAAKAIEKIAKGLSDFEPVANALRRANEEVVKEGTWELPKTPKQKSALKKLLSKPLKAKGATNKLYNIIGDDILFDDIDDFADTEPNADVRPMVRTAMKRLGIKEETILERIDRKLKERKNG